MALLSKKLAFINRALKKMSNLDFDIDLSIDGKDEAALLAYKLNGIAETKKIFDSYSNKELALNDINGDLESGRFCGETTVLYCNIRDFSKQSAAKKLEPSLDLLNIYFNCIGSSASEMGGCLDRVTGDKAMIHWGALNLLEEPRAGMIAALSSALLMRAVLSCWTKKENLTGLCFSFGAAYGAGYYFPFAAGFSREMSLLGPSVHAAWQCEAYTKARKAEILITEEIWKETEDFFVTEEVKCGNINGKETRLFALINIRDKKESKKIYTALTRIPGIDLDYALTKVGPRGPRTISDIRHELV